MTKICEFPDNWTDDSFSEFADIAIKNIAATYVNNKTEYPLLSEIDSIYFEIAQGLNNPGDRVVEPFLLYRSHAYFRASENK